MRNIEFITNGFGASTQGLGGWGDDVSKGLGALGLRPLPPQRAYAPDDLSSIRQALPGAPDIVIKAALATFDKFGPAGFQRTANFMLALQKSDDSLETLFPNLFSQPISGAKFKRLFNGLLNTAASRAGLTPLSSIFIQSYREILQEIPDSEPNALRFWQKVKGTLPRWLTDVTYMQRLAGKF